MDSKSRVVRYLVGALLLGCSGLAAAQEGQTLPTAEFLRLMPPNFVQQFPQGSQTRQVTDVRRVFDAKLPTLRAAYDEVRARNPGVQGEVDLAVALLPDGRVAGAQVVRSTLADAPLQALVLSTVQQLNFGPASSGAGYYLLWYPLVFWSQPAVSTAPPPPPPAAALPPPPPALPALAPPPAALPPPPPVAASVPPPAVALLPPPPPRASPPPPRPAAPLPPPASLPAAPRAQASAPPPVVAPAPPPPRQFTTGVVRPAPPFGASGKISGWLTKIARNVQSNWLRPTVPGDFRCLVALQVLPTGKIAGAALKEGSHDLVLDRSIFDAVVKSDPLPVPGDLADYTRNVNLYFTPR